MAVGGVRTLDGSVFPVATRTRRTGLTFGGSNVGSRDTSLIATVKPILWSGNLSNEIPIQVRFKSTLAMRIFSDLGVEGSTLTSRLLVGTVPGSTTYTSIASATWSEFENIVGNYYALSEDGVQSNVLCYLSGTAAGILSYEVLTLPIASVGIAEDLAS